MNKLIFNKEHRLRSLWTISLGMIVIFLSQILFSLPGIFLFILKGPKNYSSENYMEILSSYPFIELLIMAGGPLGSILFVFILWKWITKRKIKDIGLISFKKEWIKFIVGLILGIVSISFIFFFLYFTDKIILNNSFLNPNLTIYTFTYLIIFIVVGFSEEIFFRGYIMKVMELNKNKKWLIYLTSSVLFSLAHIFNPNVNMIGVLNIGLVGLLFSYMFIKSNSLWMPIGYHITWNYFQGNMFGFPVSGTIPHGIYDITVIEGNDFITGGSFGAEGGLLTTFVILMVFIILFVFYRKKSYSKLK